MFLTFTFYFILIFTLFPTFLHPYLSSLHYPLHKYYSFSFHLPTTLYINIILLLSLHIPLFCLFLCTLSYYKFVTIYSILCMIFSHKKRFYLSLSQFFDEFFIHSSIYAKLLIFGNPFFLSFFFFFLH